MARGPQPPAEQQAGSFSTMFGTIMSGFEPLGKEAEKGTGQFLLVTGALMIVTTMAAKLFSAFSGAFADRNVLSAVELAVMLSGSVLVLIGGAAIKIWDRHLNERAREKELQLRIDAAQHIKDVLVGDAPRAPTPIASST
jgi:hypothetical protein